jgi:hypothetical protein
MQKGFIEKLLKMFVYLIILLIYFNCIVSQLSNNESLLVFYNIGDDFKVGLFTAKFGKTVNLVDEEDSDLLVETDIMVDEIDYSLSANVIIWKENEKYDNLWFCVFYAISINKR